MARIESAKSRRYTFVVDQPLAEGEKPDTLALYLPDGTPIDLTADPSKMRWLGEWNAETEYLTNDVVMHAGQLYIIPDEDVIVPAGEDDPSLNEDWFLLTVPVTTPPPGMRWKGPWNSGTIYEENDVVYHNGALWYAPGEVNAGLQPGLIVADPTVITSRSQPMGQSKRLAEETDKLITIGPPPGMHLRPDYRFAPDWLGGFILDGNGASLNGKVITVTPNSYVGPLQKEMEMSVYHNGSTFVGSMDLQWTKAEVLAKTPKSIVYDQGNADLSFLVGYYDSGISSGHGTFVDGDFYVRVDDNTNLLASPFTGSQWVMLLPGHPVVGTRANRLLHSPLAGRQWKESDTGLLYIGDDTNWNVLNPFGHIRKTSDFTLPQSDTVFDAANNIPQFTWPMGANEIWVVESLLRLQGVSDVPDIRFEFSLPAGATYEIQVVGNTLGVGTGSSPATVLTTGVPLGIANGIFLARIVAIITNGSTAGAAQLRAAQVVSTAENVKVLANSMLFPKRIA